MSVSILFVGIAVGISIYALVLNLNGRRRLLISETKMLRAIDQLKNISEEMTVNKVRADVGLPPVENDDVQWRKPFIFNFYGNSDSEGLTELARSIQKKLQDLENEKL